MILTDSNQRYRLFGVPPYCSRTGYCHFHGVVHRLTDSTSVPDVQGVTVAALFVDPNGVYAGLEGVEVWDEERDARLYDGPYPVVAHPPCNHWCQLASVNAARYETFKIGDDGEAASSRRLCRCGRSAAC